MDNSSVEVTSTMATIAIEAATTIVEIYSFSGQWVKKLNVK